MALSFDLLTGLTISGILAILAIYLIVVYKKGWLKNESKTEQAYYLCPNQKCKRVFKKPVWLTDLSKTPPTSYQACPHCGLNIQTITSPSSLANPVSDTVSRPPPSPVKVRGRRERLHFIKKAPAAIKAESGREFRNPNPHSDAPSSPPKSEDAQLPKPLFQFPKIRKNTPQESSEMPEKSVGKGAQESPKKCSHFFGYVRTLPKNTPIPDECLWCPSIVDCLTQEQKVEAEA